MNENLSALVSKDQIISKLIFLKKLFLFVFQEKGIEFALHSKTYVNNILYNKISSSKVQWKNSTRESCFELGVTVLFNFILYCQSLLHISLITPTFSPKKTTILKVTTRSNC